MNNSKISGKFTFSKEDKKSLLKFVNFLLEKNCEINIWNDEYYFVVEYIEEYCKDDYSFEPIDKNSEEIVKIRDE